jgi:hypothetical protein
MTPTDIKHAEFTKELKELLLKYDATIEACFDDSTDTYGIQGEYMAVSYRLHPTHFRFCSKKLSDGFGVTASDL